MVEPGSEEDVKKKVTSKISGKEFRFGGGEKLISPKLYKIPAVLGGRKVMIITEVVFSQLPLLLSLYSMKKAGIVLDTANDTAMIYGKNVQLDFTSCGHYCVNLIENEAVDV